LGCFWMGMSRKATVDNTQWRAEEKQREREVHEQAMDGPGVTEAEMMVRKTRVKAHVREPQPGSDGVRPAGDGANIDKSGLDNLKGRKSTNRPRGTTATGVSRPIGTE